jgi:hypothetical protein
MKKEIHPIIKKTLGFDESISDREFLKDWKKISTQVCKPCWELKYCPYGPFVEQSPLLPSLRQSSIEYNEGLVNFLETNTFGGQRKLSKEEIEKKKEELKIFKKHPRFLLPEIFREMNHEELFKDGAEKNLELHEILPTPYQNLEKYKVPYPLYEDESKTASEVLKEIKTIELTPELNKRINQKIENLKKTIKSGVEDNRQPLDPIRRKFFERSVREFNPDDHPEYIPDVITDMSCNIFGHICPVVFVGESITETTEKRRKGRYISFKTKMRVVRRDNYTCQECSCHLKDDEVEFDHIIPVSKGGSSEEHNVRLTCYDCNRDKLDKVQL